MIKKIVVISFLFAFTFPVFASSVDTISIYSNSMHRDFKCVVIKPDSLKDAVAWPVVYLLHGYSGGYNNWIMRVPALMDYAEMYHLVIVESIGLSRYQLLKPPSGQTITRWYISA